MKWDQRAADLINPVNEEKTKEAETQLEITNTVQSCHQNQQVSGLQFENVRLRWIQTMAPLSVSWPLKDCDSTVTFDLWIRVYLHELLRLRDHLFGFTASH